jgi:Flp pilus assembly protein TadG
MSTLSLTLIFAIVGLAVEVGWAMYIRTLAQSASDAAALGAASQALSTLGQTAKPVCSVSVYCQSMTNCPASGNLQSGCLYAQQNGFTPGGAGGRQTVQIAAGTSTPIPGVSNVPGVTYWTQVYTSQSIPALFSAILGSVGLSTGARSTAAILPHPITPSVYLLNRSTDCFASLLNLGVVCGEDFLSLLSSNVKARGGIYMSSGNSAGTPLPNVAAATIVGGATVTSPFTYIMGNGGVNTIGLSNWSAAPQNGFADGDDFRDPMRGKGQPPVPTGLPDHPVPGGVIIGSLLGGATVLPPGNYYSTNPLTGTPLGTPVTVTGNVVFSDGNTPPCGGFCNYIFYGGVVVGALGTTTFAPGRYVFAGAQPVAGGPAVALMANASAVVKDMTPLVGGQATQNSDAGEIFIFTDSNYPGLKLPAAIADSGLSFPQVTAGFQGLTGFTVTLHGLNGSNSSVPSDLQDFSPVLFWQDQANTTLSYNSDGSLNTSCGSVCTHILSVPGSQQMIIGASQVGGQAGVNLYGTIYAPRGAWTTLLGVLPGDTIRGPLQLITGSLQMAVNTTLDVTPLPNPMTRMTVSLIQ